MNNGKVLNEHEEDEWCHLEAKSGDEHRRCGDNDVTKRQITVESH